MIDKRLMKEGKRVSAYLGTSVILGIAIAFLAVAQAYYVSQVIDRVFLEKNSLVEVWSFLLIILGIIFTRAVFMFLQEVSAKEAAIRVKSDLRERFIDKILALGPLFVRGEREGELINTAIEGIENLDEYFTRFLPQLVMAVFIPIMILFFVFPIDVTSGLILLLTGPLIPFFMILIGRLAEKKSLAQWQSLSRMSAHFLDVLKGLITLKVFGRSLDQAQVIHRVSDSFRRATLSVLRIAFLSSFVLEFLAMLSTALVAVTLGIRLIDGDIHYAQALFLLILSPEYYQPLRTLGSQFHARLSGVHAANRIYVVLELEKILENELKDSNDYSLSEVLQNKKVSYESYLKNKKDVIETNVLLKFRNVSLKYDKDSMPVLKDVNFEVYVGERIAVVGPSGAGKTSIFNLILSFIEPNSGEIGLHGVPISKVSKANLYKTIAYVSQKPYLFAGSILDNLRVGREDATEKEMIDAAKLALAHEFIVNLPDGYNTLIGEGGTRLSGGQMQRIAIARAFLKRAPLLLLDEPTSGLDYKNEREVQAAIDNLIEGHTVIYIAHKMETVKNADRILVIDEGSIKEEGKHDELIARDGLYAKFVCEYRGEER